MRLPDGQPIKRPPPPPRPPPKAAAPKATDPGPKARTGTGGGTSGGGRDGGGAAASAPGTQADTLARQRTPTDDALDAPSPVQTLRTERTWTERVAGDGTRVPRDGSPPPGTPPVAVVHTSYPGAAAGGTGTITPDGIPVADFMALRTAERTDEEIPAAGAEPAPEDDLATRVAAYDVADEEVEQILADLDTLENGTQDERVQALFSLAQNLQPEEIGELTESLDIDDNAVVKLLTDTDAIGAVATLVDADASEADKVSAAITLAESTGDLAGGSLERALERPLAAISAGQELISLIETFRDPEAGALEKAEATLAFATAAKDSIAGLAPTLAHDLGRLDSLGNGVSAALTLLDPEASNADRAKAVAALFANVPEVRDDLGELSGELVDRVLGRHAPVAFHVPEELARTLDPEVLESLTPEQLHRIGALGEELRAPGANAAGNALHDALSTLDDPASVDTLLDLVESQPDTAARKALSETFGGLRPGVLDDLLANGGDGARAIADILPRLDEDGRKAFAKVVGGFDADAIEILTRFGGQVDAGVLQDFLKVADKLPGRELGQALKFLDDALRAAGVALTPDSAARLFKGFGKLVPAVGAIPAAYDIGRLGGVVADTSLPDDIRYLAATGVKINGADVVSSVAEAFFGWAGVPIAADVGIGIAALAVDLIVADQQSRYEAAQAAGEEYSAPEWLTTLNVSTAAAQGPPGWIEYWAIYGADDGVEALGVAARSGGTAAIDAAEGLLTLGAEGIGDGLEMTADGLHLLADIVRNPDVYGERAAELGRQAVDRLGELAEGAGELARAAGKELKDLAGDLRELGKDGLEALGWIASNPGEAADIAVEAIGDVARDGIALGTRAGRRAAAAALATLDTVIDAGGRAVEAAKEVIDDVTGRLVDLGREGIETLGWIASNPGEAADIARTALRDVAVQGGEYARAAYEEILDLGEDGVELAEDVARELVDLGEDGIEMLAFVAENPGEAAGVALEGLRNLAEGVGEAAERAAGKIVDLAESGVAEAEETLETLLLEGGEAIRNVVSALGDEIGPGVLAVIDGLADLGDAGRDALVGLADAGLDFAQEGLAKARETIGDFGSWAWNNTGGRAVDAVGDAWDWAFGR